MATRIRDIADTAGVSVTTASHVLRGYTKSKIKKETWDRVIKVADDLGYRPNAIARSLKIQRTNTIGLYTGYGYHSLNDPFLAEIYTGIQQTCSEVEYDFLVHGGMEGKSPNEIRLKLSDGKVAGLIVHAQPGDAVVRELAAPRMPAVAIADRQPMFPSVVADDAHGMRLLADYIWERGHRNVVFLSAHRTLASVDARSKALTELIQDRGGQCATIPYPIHAMEEYLADLLKQPQRPTVFFCWNDFYAYDMLRACSRIGARVPDDVAVVGFDGLLDTLLPARALVTVAIPWKDMAAEAARMLVREIEGDTLPPLTTFPVQLIEGDTV